MNNRGKTFKSSWWSVEVPTGWTVKEDDACVTLSGARFASALQISAARKDTGSVTDDELKEFARAQAPDEKMVGVNLPLWKGFYAEQVENGVFWKYWWLRAGNLMVYVTYNVDERFEEEAIVDSVLESLVPA